MSEDDLTKCITKYFREPTVDRNNLAKLMNYVEDFASRNFQIHFIQKLFRLAQSNMAKDNLKVITKRQLHIINQILQKDEQVMQPFKYQQAVSAEIVPHFISMLKNVLNYGPMDLFPDMKLFRKRWAKRITDQAYMAMQTEAQKQLKVDLDKGFQEDIVKKLTKSYQKRQFSKSDFDKYLPTSNNQSIPQSRKGSTARSQSSEEERTKKRVKRQSEEKVAEKRNQYSDMVMPSHSFNPSPSNTFMYASDPRRHVNYPPPPVYPVYPSYPPYQPPHRVINSSVGQNHPGYYGHNPNFYPSNFHNNYNYPTGYPEYANGHYNQPQRYQPPPQTITSSKHFKILQKIDSLKKNWFFECKVCGLMMTTNQKYQQHKLDHFNEAQKQYQVSHSRAEHSRRGNKPLLPTKQEWIQSKRVKLNDQKYQVLIQEDSNRSQLCTICKGQLKVSWSEDLQSWVYDDAIKTKLKTQESSKRSICHAECYHTLNEFEKSSDELIK